MTTEEQKARRAKVMKYAAIVGALLALVCHMVPPEYRAACELVSTITSSCSGTGGF